MPESGKKPSGLVLTHDYRYFRAIPEGWLPHTGKSPGAEDDYRVTGAPAPCRAAALAVAGGVIPTVRRRLPVAAITR